MRGILSISLLNPDAGVQNGDNCGLTCEHSKRQLIALVFRDKLINYFEIKQLKQLIESSRIIQFTILKKTTRDINFPPTMSLNISNYRDRSTRYWSSAWLQWTTRLTEREYRSKRHCRIIWLASQPMRKSTAVMPITASSHGYLSAHVKRYYYLDNWKQWNDITYTLADFGHLILHSSLARTEFMDLTLILMKLKFYWIQSPIQLLSMSSHDVDSSRGSTTRW